MSYFNLDKETARLILFQRNEIMPSNLKKLRKLFGRYIFTNFLSKFFISPKLISYKYYELMLREYELLTKYLNFNNRKILSIGSGMCGLEILINSNFKNSFFSIIEKNYVSKKVVYGWDNTNSEAYNRINLLKSFFLLFIHC